MFTTNESRFSEAEVVAVWNKGTIVGGYDPAKWRKDSSGAWINYDKYGNTASKYGWEVDHIKPLAKGGSDYLSNLQPLQWENNRSKSDDYPNYCTSVTSEGNKNIDKTLCFQLTHS